MTVEYSRLGAERRRVLGTKAKHSIGAFLAARGRKDAAKAGWRLGTPESARGRHVRGRFLLCHGVRADRPLVCHATETLPCR